MRRDIHQAITERFIEQLKRGTVPWQKPWLSVQNIVSRKSYRGINALLLGSTGYRSPFWVSFKQARDLGGQVKKGEKSTPVIYYKLLEKHDKAGNVVVRKDGSPYRIPFVRWSNVFNLDQTEGITPPAITATQSVTQPREKAAAIVENAKLCPIHHAGFAACYLPKDDIIRIPVPSTFYSQEGYYHTLYHEMTHATGHGSRLNREGITQEVKFGSERYSQEELLVRRVGTKEGVNTCKTYVLDSWENPCEPDLPVPVKSRLKSRKRNGTIACREKAQTAEAIVGGAGHRKMPMAKAKLPEPQSSGSYPRGRRSDGCNVAPCSNRIAMRSDRKEVMQLSASGPARTACPPLAGSKGRMRRLIASYLFNCVNTGSSKWERKRPPGRQNRHSSQRPGVISGTVILGWTATDESLRATGAGVLTGWVKGGSASETGQSTRGTC